MRNPFGFGRRRLVEQKVLQHEADIHTLSERQTRLMRRLGELELEAQLISRRQHDVEEENAARRPKAQG